MSPGVSNIYDLLQDYEIYTVKSSPISSMDYEIVKAVPASVAEIDTIVVSSSP